MTTPTPAYLNTDLSFEDRARDLLARMTLEEKCAQLNYNAPAVPPSRHRRAQLVERMPPRRWPRRPRHLLPPGHRAGRHLRHRPHAIIMNPNQVNARVVLPVTTYETVTKGFPVDMVIYANNYEQIDDDHPIIEALSTPETALRVFREGTAMSKGTTTSTGLVHTYFVNVFGPVQYKTLHDEIAKRFFNAFFAGGIFVGHLRTRLGIAGCERNGPEEAAQALLQMISGGK